MGVTSVQVVPEGAVTPIVEQTRVDANGGFQFDDVPPGDYTVIIQSSHSMAVTMRDVNGRLVSVPTQVRTGHTSDASYSFPATAASM
jgi:hypothetical protein